MFVSPTGESLLFDTGFPGNGDRDAKRIYAAAQNAGLRQIDHVVISHWHADHEGGLNALSKMIPLGKFYDHGDGVEQSDRTRLEDYKTIAGNKRTIVKPGDTIPMEGVDIRVLTAAGEHIATAVAGGGEENPLCGEEPEAAEDDSENARSLGLLVTYGSFRALDLGDLTRKKELELVCPKNLIGRLDLYVVSHHGLAQSNSRALVDAVHPRVAVMDNGARKGGSPEAWQTVHDSPGLEDLWQLHYSVEGGAEHNVAESFIANPEEGEKDRGYWVKVAAEWDASFTVVNARNGSAKTYRK